MRWIPVHNAEDCPENDDHEDFPRRYILRCKIDGGRGHFWVYNCIASTMMETAICYDYAEFLDETPDAKDAEIARLKSLIPIARQIGYNEGSLGDNAKPDTDWKRFVKENKL